MESTIILAIIIPLFISLIAYTTSLTLKHIEYRSTINRLNNELATTRAKLATLNEKKDQEITDIKKISDTRISELSETITDIQAEHDNILLNETQIKILKFLWKQPSSIEDKIAKDLWIDLEIINFHLAKLRKLKMIQTKRHPGINATYDVWLLDHEGRGYLIDNKLI